MKLYQNLARMYDLLYAYRNYEKEVDFLVQNLLETTNPRLLDVACGTGMHLDILRKKLPLAILAGIDLNQGMLDVAGGKSIDADLVQADMRDFRMDGNFDIVYCLSSSIQYNLSREDFERTIASMRKHAIDGKVIFDLAYCAERWTEGFTNITANSDDRFEVAELYTSHSKGGFSFWNPLYLIKDKQTGQMDMHVDRHKIKLWKISEVEELLKFNGIPFSLRRGFSETGTLFDVPIFILEGIKK